MGLSGTELRKVFLDYFKDMKGAPHRLVTPAPLIPPDDPTLLFTSAGMVQFKRYYSGEIEPLPYSRATTCQPCLRAGGKGSDLENVGKTLRHHTLFEMLGNFSFGDYFKREAIRWAWHFVTVEMGLPKERLFPTIFEEDSEAEKLWQEETDACYRPVRLDAKQNFWGPAGDTGACGPCSEVCFFMGTDEELAEVRRQLDESEDKYMPELARRIDEEGDLFLEIWNMVFPQFDQQRDGTRPQLKYRGIDTGAGLERMTTALMWLDGKASTPYETDLLQPIVQAASNTLGVQYLKILDEGGDTPEATRIRLAINAIADHTRALVFCLSEGITPGNVGRGYVIRRIQRRALRFASLLGKDEAFMPTLVDPVIETMGSAYPQLAEKAEFIRRALRIEEEAFLKTRNRGLKLLDELLEQARDRSDNLIPGSEAFKLWDTYGFPLDLTREIAEDQNVRIDLKGFDDALREQKERGRASWQGAQLDKDAELAESIAAKHGATVFTGYASTREERCKVIALIADGKLVEKIEPGTRATVILDRTPFYAESGGQVGDTGKLLEAHDCTFDVFDTQKTAEGIFLHWGELETGILAVGEVTAALVDEQRRMAIRRNHSTTHLLQAALKKYVGTHVAQQGSWVGPESLRFDFTNPEAVSPEVLRKVQEEVNRLIIEDLPVTTDVLPLEEARQRGAIAPFGEKYGPEVRVVQMGSPGHVASIEFCGGIHLDRTGQAARFRIVAEGSIASGVRRIEAVTGETAARLEAEEQYGVVQPLQLSLAVKGDALVERVGQLSQRIKQLEKELARERQKAALSNVDQIAQAAVAIDGARVAATLLEGLSANDLRTLAATLREKIGSDGIGVAATVTDGKVAIVAAVGESARKRYPAGKVVNALAEPMGGKGGGKPDMAQAGAREADKAADVIARAAELIGALAL
ncbi:MAG: alanyl-tRNA synthetase [Candidatus Sumerlaeota bacterium]|nr:alanyl-tRNA synthetase [Candidatus Sumerlaeota bacterium]